MNIPSISGRYNPFTKSSPHTEVSLSINRTRDRLGVLHLQWVPWRLWRCPTAAGPHLAPRLGLPLRLWLKDGMVLAWFPPLSQSLLKLLKSNELDILSCFMGETGYTYLYIGKSCIFWSHPQHGPVSDRIGVPVKPARTRRSASNRRRRKRCSCSAYWVWLPWSRTWRVGKQKKTVWRYYNNNNHNQQQQQPTTTTTTTTTTTNNQQPTTNNNNHNHNHNNNNIRNWQPHHFVWQLTHWL